MSKERTTTRLWNRTSKALGKLLAGMVSLYDERREQRPWTDYPRFPPY